jgi:Secretion system C-terminal sorting domain/Kelch motif
MIYIYIYLGNDSNGAETQNSMYRYNTLTDVWDSRASFPGQVLLKSMSTVVVDSMMYMVGGGNDTSYIGNYYGSRYDFWRYDIHADRWDSLPPFPGLPRLVPVVFGFKNFLLAGFGFVYIKTSSGPYLDSSLRDMYRYDYATRSWSPVNYTGAIPGLSSWGTFFQYGHKCYIVNGLKSPYFFSPEKIDTNVWVMDPSPLHPIWLDSTVVTGVEELQQGGDYFRFYPNPNSGTFTLETDAQLGSEYHIYDMLGQVVQEGKVHTGQQYINMTGAPTGIYTLQLDGKGDRASTRFAKTPQ